LILFTDGEETDHLEPDDFFNPCVQAKRLRYGLGCKTNSDCTEDAVCSEGFCMPAPLTGPDDPQIEEKAAFDEMLAAPDDDPIHEILGYDDPEDAETLRSYGGRPLSVKIHLVDVKDAGTQYTSSPQAHGCTNRRVAALGGGKYVPGDLGDSSAISALLSEMQLMIDVKKSPICVEAE
jgi:hypothetical protein